MDVTVVHYIGGMQAQHRPTRPSGPIATRMVRRVLRAVSVLVVVAVAFALPSTPASGGGASGLVGLLHSEEPVGGLVPLVIGGTDTPNPGYVAALLSVAVTDPFQAQFCGGSLISDQVVMTAAHCVDSLTVDDFGVAIGFTALSDIGAEDRSSVAEIEIHPQWADDITSVDIALLRLVEPVTELTPVPIDDDVVEPVFGRPLVVAGWGAVEVTRTFFPDVMQAAGVTTLTDTTTSALFGLLTCGLVDPADDFCYGGITTAGCSGDSGGPLLGETSPGSELFELTGIVSYGPASQCLAPTQFDGAQRVSSYKPWIDEVLALWASTPPTTTTTSTTTTTTTTTTNTTTTAPPEVVLEVKVNCPSPALPFIDVKATSFAYDDIACIYGLDITTGTSASTYSPGGVVTREQMAAFIARTIRAL